MRIAGDGSLVEGVPVISTSPAYQMLHRLDVDRGRFLAWHDLNCGSRVAVLSYSLAQTLYARSDAIGSKVQVGDEWLTVVGVLQPRGDLDGSALGDVSRALFRPINSDLPVDELVVRFHDDVELGSAGSALRRIIEYHGEGDFEYVLPVEVMRNKYRLQLTIGYLLTGISAVLLVVGEVGIANVMLLNVVRRTPEIGLRRAVGASQGSILTQFLIEAAMISLAGGALGIVAGVIVAAIVAETAAWPIALLGTACILGAVLSLIVGLVSGIIPAWHAARLDPTVCLSRS
jgi:putative ABC transport system permease protein